MQSEETSVTTAKCWWQRPLFHCLAMTAFVCLFNVAMIGTAITYVFEHDPVPEYSYLAIAGPISQYIVWPIFAFRESPISLFFAFLLASFLESIPLWFIVFFAHKDKS